MPLGPQDACRRRESYQEQEQQRILQEQREREQREARAIREEVLRLETVLPRIIDRTLVESNEVEIGQGCRSVTLNEVEISSEFRFMTLWRKHDLREKINAIYQEVGWANVEINEYKPTRYDMQRPEDPYWGPIQHRESLYTIRLTTEP